jgi:hypothetical protein
MQACGGVCGPFSYCTTFLPFVERLVESSLCQQVLVPDQRTLTLESSCELHRVAQFSLRAAQHTNPAISVKLMQAINDLLNVPVGDNNSSAKR